MAGVGFQPHRHLLQHVLEGFHGNLPLVLVQDADEAGHVRALEVMGQVHVHVERGDRVLLAGGAVLDPHRVRDVLDAYPVDRNAPRVGAALHIFDADSLVGLKASRIHRVSHQMPPTERARVAAWRAHQRSIVALSDGASSPARLRQSSREPCSTKRSGIPMCSIDTWISCAASSSPMALPAPPATTFSSSVITALCREAICTTRSSSSGLMNRRFTSVASRRSAIFCAGATMEPTAISARPERPWRLISARPRGIAFICCTTGVPGPVPRGYRTAAGPCSVEAVYS